MDPIEGLWCWSDDAYEIAIKKNTTGLEQAYEYVGILVRSETGGWRPGQIKLLLNSTAVEGIFTGVYFMGDQSREKTSFVLDDNLIKTQISAQSGDVLIIRTFPKKPKTAPVARSSEKESASQGSGFFVSKDGLIITNYHVVEDAKAIVVRLPDGRKQNATVIRSSPATDIVLLKCDVTTEHFIPLQGTEGVNIGDPVYTIGYPSVDLLGAEAKLTDGVVSAMSGLRNDTSFMQVTVPIQPGNSGGPLISKATGRAIGVVTSTAAVAAFYRLTGSLPQNVNWAVKSDYAKLLLPSASGEAKNSDAFREPTEVAKAIVIIESTLK